MSQEESSSRLGTSSTPGGLRGGREQSAACGPGPGPLNPRGWAQSCGAPVPEMDAGRRRDANSFARLNSLGGKKGRLYFALILCSRVFFLRVYVLRAT